MITKAEESMEKIELLTQTNLSLALIMMLDLYFQNSLPRNVN